MGIILNILRLKVHKLKSVSTQMPVSSFLPYLLVTTYEASLAMHFGRRPIFKSIHRAAEASLPISLLCVKLILFSN